MLELKVPLNLMPIATNSDIIDLSSEKNQQLPYNESEIIPLIDSIKDLVTEIPETDDDK